MQFNGKPGTGSGVPDSARNEGSPMNGTETLPQFNAPYAPDDVRIARSLLGAAASPASAKPRSPTRRAI